MTKRSRITRRNFLKVSAVGGVVFVGGSLLLADALTGNPSSTATNVIRSQPLPIPKLLTGRDIDGQKVYDLTMRQGSMVFVPGKKTATWGYNGNILGPTMLMNKGDEVAINQCDQSIG